MVATAAAAVLDVLSQRGDPSLTRLISDSILVADGLPQLISQVCISQVSQAVGSSKVPRLHTTYTTIFSSPLSYEQRQENLQLHLTQCSVTTFYLLAT